ncbi:MAG: hypothetical protein H6707_06890 [Deltaproteobacteria bacterium]|nr:hypothetical protein [Deltaproteobacteria bacterium]
MRQRPNVPTNNAIAQAARHGDTRRLAKMLVEVSDELREHPGDISRWVQLAELLAYISRPDEAVILYNALAQRYAHQDDFPQAAMLCRRALTLDEHHHPSRRLLAAVEARRLTRRAKQSLQVDRVDGCWVVEPPKLPPRRARRPKTVTPLPPGPTVCVRRPGRQIS